MDEHDRTRIASALQQYRETVSEHNLLLVTTLVEALEEEDLSDCTDETAEELRITELKEKLQVDLPESVTSPRDVLDNDEARELVLSQLDGIVAGPNPAEERAAYFAQVKARIGAKHAEAAAGFPPSELEYLCTLVGGITGAGLGYHVVSESIDFVSPTAGQAWLDKWAREVSVLAPDGDQAADRNHFRSYWEGWQVAVVVALGKAPRTGGSFAVYCRRGDKPQWQWRYSLVSEDWSSDLYDGVEEFLSFYAHFEEQDEESLREDISIVTY